MRQPLNHSGININQSAAPDTLSLCWTAGPPVEYYCFMKNQTLRELTRRIRHDILTMTTTAGSGHPTSSLSAAELMTALFFSYLRYDMKHPENPGNDRVIFSKGHASPLYYALYAAAGVITPADLLKYRTFDSVLEGHPTERFAYTEAATGSLGQGLSIGLGESLAIRLQYGATAMPRVFVLAGDGELAEGSVWEAAAAASFRHVDNLYLLVDVNRLGQSDPTMYGHDLSVFEKRFEAFGWNVVLVEKGNDQNAIDAGFAKAFSSKGKPTVVLAKTLKGAGISFLSDASGWHGKPLSKDELPRALAELGTVDTALTGAVLPPLPKPKSPIAAVAADELAYPADKAVATRKAFGNALKRLGGKFTDMVVIDGDTKNSTFTEFFQKEYPDRFFEMFIAEQNMAGIAVGMSARGFHPVVSTFACFLSRAADQIRMATFSGSDMLVNGSHAGVSIGEDGPSQMGLEDISLFRSVRGSTVLYPSDAVSTERLTELALGCNGVVYIRTSRPETAVLYTPTDTFTIGGSKVFHARYRESTDQNISVSMVDTGNQQIKMNQKNNAEQKELLTVVGAGVTLHEALKAQSELARQSIYIRVIDCYSVKPIDAVTLRQAAHDTKAIIVVEDHYPEGGLGEAVKSALAADPNVPVIHLAVYKTPRSGKAAQLMDYEGIAAADIAESVREFIKAKI